MYSMSEQEYDSLLVFGKKLWDYHRFPEDNDGWKDCVHDAIMEIYEEGIELAPVEVKDITIKAPQPTNTWEKIVRKAIERERARRRRNRYVVIDDVAKDRFVSYDTVGDGDICDYDTPESILIKLESGEL